MGMIVGMVMIAFFVALAIWLLGSGGAMLMSARSGRGKAHDQSVGTVHYRVPDGQDSVAVLTALAGRGFEAAPLFEAGHSFVVVPCPRGTPQEREEIRQAIASADTRAAPEERVPVRPDVRFEEEL